MKNSNLYKRIISKENIFNAIYSLESYVFEKELLIEDDIKLYNDLSDKHNINLINKVVEKCIKSIEDILTSDSLFQVTVFFKPKKFNKEEKKLEYRPIHTSDLITQICIVALLNQLMFDDSDGTRKLSDISRLLPSNFYGNIPSTKIEHLFKPWNRQYQEYSKKAIDAHRQYFSSKKYTHEVNLDIKKFYPSINPIFIYDFILQKCPITYLKGDIKCLEKLLEKLLFFDMSIPNESLSLYYPEELKSGIISDKLFFNIGIPQGLPQAYFFGNLCMVVISKAIEEIFKGEAFYYVDDSVIYTDKPQNNFFDSIKTLNSRINEEISKTITSIIRDKRIKKFQNLLSYNVKIHDTEDGKSSLSVIDQDLSLYLFAKPASNISFEIIASMDELEDSSLHDKISTIIDAIKLQIKYFEDKTHIEDENVLKLLKRYKKFYINRLNILRLRDENEIDQNRINEFFEKYDLNSSIEESAFFSRLEDDVFSVESKLLIRQLTVKQEQQKKIINKIKEFETKFERNGSKLNHYFSTVLKNHALFQNLKNKRYETLENITINTIESFSKVKQKKKIDIIYSLLKVLQYQFKDENTIELEKPFWRIIFDYQENYHFIYKNSPDFLRRIVNAIISRAFNVSINDSCNLTKLDNRVLLYYELRILMLLRTNHFSLEVLINNTTRIMGQLETKQNQEKIDLSLLEVLPIFKSYIKDSEKIDDLILIHKYVNGIWKNGSKFLHFYTLHNEEHSIELINKCIRITKSIDYLSIKSEDYYILFLACYLHDISMVLYPNLDSFSETNEKTDLVYSRWKTDLSIIENIEKEPQSKIKSLILKYYKEVNDYFETEIRDNHHKRSSKFIKEQNDFFFIDKAVRRLVADVSEAHCYDAKDVYKLKSKAKSDIYDEKYLMIILRLADLLDMSKDRVSINILRQNINNMSETSKYHWISHMAIDNCSITSEFPKIAETDFDENGKLKLTEIIQINIFMNTRLLTSAKSNNCANLSCKTERVNKSNPNMTIEINRGQNCVGRCNFTCRWLVNKHNYLFNELIELQQYLDRNINNIFETKLEVKLNFENSSVLPSDYMDVIKKRIEI
ncbi:hypothetical protein EMN47_17200 [Prolixibacteraceae bacterium JC049]|nr:hypothetical protein [Prolixibacteraceae bacterium JC049]